jgi:peptide deformylase
VLREIAQSVSVAEITSPHIQNIVKDMQKALASQEDGVAIAAPQIGVPLRIFVVSGIVLDMMKNSHVDEKEFSKKSRGENMHNDMVFINPTITKLSKETEMMEEGCLSVRYLYGKVRRSSKATVTAYDKNGKKFQRGGSGLMAQIFQHETDHLDGVLFLDKAVDAEEMPPQKDSHQ